MKGVIHGRTSIRSYIGCPRDPQVVSACTEQRGCSDGPTRAGNPSFVAWHAPQRDRRYSRAELFGCPQDHQPFQCRGVCLLGRQTERRSAVEGNGSVCRDAQRNGPGQPARPGLSFQLLDSRTAENPSGPQDAYCFECCPSIARDEGQRLCLPPPEAWHGAPARSEEYNEKKAFLEFVKRGPRVQEPPSICCSSMNVRFTSIRP